MPLSTNTWNRIVGLVYLALVMSSWLNSFALKISKDVDAHQRLRGASVDKEPVPTLTSYCVERSMGTDGKYITTIICISNRIYRIMSVMLAVAVLIIRSRTIIKN